MPTDRGPHQQRVKPRSAGTQRHRSTGTPGTLRPPPIARRSGPSPSADSGVESRTCGRARKHVVGQTRPSRVIATSHALLDVHERRDTDVIATGRTLVILFRTRRCFRSAHRTQCAPSHSDFRFRRRSVSRPPLESGHSLTTSADTVDTVDHGTRRTSVLSVSLGAHARNKNLCLGPISPSTINLIGLLFHWN